MSSLRTVKTEPAQPAHYSFAEGSKQVPSLAGDERIALLAVSVANQQRAGFRALIDIRQFSCPDCGSAGFNSGWGTVDFACGASWAGSDDEWEAFDRCVCVKEVAQ